MVLSQLCVDVRRAVKDVGGPPRLPGPSTSPFSAQALSKGPGCTLLSATFLPFLLVISLFKMAPKNNTKVLSIVSKPKKAMMCLLEKIQVLRRIQT